MIMGGLLFVIVAAAVGYVVFEKYSGADLACEERPPGSLLYHFTILRDHVVVGRLNLSGDSEQLKPYQGNKISFRGSMTCFVGVHGKDPQTRVVNVAPLRYELDSRENAPLSTLGVVSLNKCGFVESDTAKSGWIRWGAWLSFDDGGRSRRILLQDVSFWVNRAGENWLSFSIGKAQEDGVEVPVAVVMGHEGPNGIVTIWVENKHAFHPSVKNETTLEFVRANPGVTAVAPAPSLTHGIVTASNPIVHESKDAVRAAGVKPTTGKSSWRTYANTTEGIEINYPAAWKESQKRISGMIAGFVAPKRAAGDVFLSNVAITSTDISSHAMTVEQYAASVISRMQKSFEGATVEENSSADLSGHLGVRVVLRTGGQKPVVIVLHALVHENRVYNVTYMGMAAYYPADAAVVEEMMDSLKCSF